MTGDRFRYRFQRSNLLGTIVEVSFDVGDDSGPSDRSDEYADLVADWLFVEFDRLQAVFSAFDASSELSRWRSGGRLEPSDELAALLRDARGWQQRTGGLLNPLAGELSDLWLEAEAAGREPDPDSLQAAAEAIAAPRFSILNGRPVPHADCSRLNLNAIAKGHIVDRVVATVARRFAVDNLLINAGGDLCHHGSTSARIGIENPHRPFDNEPPLHVIEITNEAMAGSGPSRRGFVVGDRRFNHVLDPRTGRPATGSAGVSVVAGSALVADVVATASSILPPAEAVAFIDELDEVQDDPRMDGTIAGLVIAHDQTQHPSRRWRERFGRH